MLVAVLPVPVARLVALPEVKGLPAPHPYAISPDGTIVVGGFSPANGFRYRVSNGSLSRFSPGGRAVYPNSVATGGNVIAGVAKNAFLFRGGKYQNLPPLSGDSASVASAVSSDGSVAVGYSQSEEGAFRAMIWRGGAGRRLGIIIGYPDMHARGVARLGRTIVGVAYDAARSVRAFAWGDLGGTRLLTIPTWATGSVANAVTPDGRFAVGSVSSKSKTRAAKWNLATGFVSVLPGTTTSEALAIDPAGRWVGGFDGERGVMWDPNGREIDLPRLFDVSGRGWKFDDVSGIGRSGDRVVLCGWGARGRKSAGFVGTFDDATTLN